MGFPWMAKRETLGVPRGGTRTCTLDNQRGICSEHKKELLIFKSAPLYSLMISSTSELYIFY